MKKIDRSTAFLQDQLDLFRCPVCQLPYSEVVGHGIKCSNGHELDLSKKGTLFFLNHDVSSEYDASMLSARRRILTAGLFDGFLEEIIRRMPKTGARILDIGSGEGTPLVKVLNERHQSDDVAVGFDISKPGINLATQLESNAFWCVADLARLPFNDQSFDTIIDIFSPSAYSEFNRVLANGGQLLKVVPNSNYLIELRQLLYDKESKHRSYSNDNVVDLFMQHYPNADAKRIVYQMPILPAQFADLLSMTPLSWGVDESRLDVVREMPINEITVDVTLLSVEA